MSKILFHLLRKFCGLSILLMLSSFSAGQNLFEGDFCNFAGYEGTCLIGSKCMDLQARMEELGLINYDVGHCGYKVTEEIICCPNSTASAQADREKSQPDEDGKADEVPKEGNKQILNANSLTVEMLNERLNEIFNKNPNPQKKSISNANLTPANDQCVSYDVVMQRMKSVFESNIVPESERDGEDRVPDSIIRKRLESILKAKLFTNTNPEVKVNSEIKPETRFTHFGIDGGRPPIGTQLLNVNKNIKCETKHYKGTCTGRSKCTHLNNYLKELNLNENDVEYCAEADKICCPIPERAADRACRAFEGKSKTPSIGLHILGGHKVRPTEYPHMAYIVNDNGNFTCGGTLIHKRFVLTAAHCIKAGDEKPLKVILGIADFNNAAEEVYRQDIYIKRTYVHGKYIPGSGYYDIGLLELAQDADFSLTVYPTCLHTDQEELPDGIELTVTGWGLTEKGDLSEHLLAVKLNYVPILQCKESYQPYIRPIRLYHGIDETHLCAGAPNKDACRGDSGGPLHLVVDPAHNKYRVVGVVSFGLVCGSNVPGAYTRVAKFLDFIEEIVWPEEMEMQ